MRLLLMGAFLGGLVLVGCSSSARSPAEVSISLRELQFQPRDVTVRAGAVVTFVNNDVAAHNVVNLAPAAAAGRVPSAGQASGGVAKPGFESVRLEPGDRWQVRFEETGAYEILCLTDAHYVSGMTGRIRVR